MSSVEKARAQKKNKRSISFYEFPNNFVDVILVGCTSKAGTILDLGVGDVADVKLIVF